MIRWVAFDVGETLFDERGLWGRWADWMGVEREVFLAELRCCIREGRHHRQVFDVFRPGFDLARAQADRLADGDTPGFAIADLFPDVRAAFSRLKGLGFKIAIAGNTGLATEATVAAAGLGQDLVASAARWGVEKPDARFFQALAEACDCGAGEIAYVGDRLDNDVLPSVAAGMAGTLAEAGIVGRGT